MNRKEPDMADIGEFSNSATLKASDVETDKTLTIKLVEKTDQYDGKPVIHWREEEKGLVANQTNLKRIAAMYGRDYTKWGGKKVTLFADMVDFKGDIVPAVRVKVTRPTAGQAPLSENPADGVGDEVEF
jgi:hypothetical protein